MKEPVIVTVCLCVCAWDLQISWIVHAKTVSTPASQAWSENRWQIDHSVTVIDSQWQSTGSLNDFMKVHSKALQMLKREVVFRPSAKGAFRSIGNDVTLQIINDCYDRPAGWR